MEYNKYWDSSDAQWEKVDNVEEIDLSQIYEIDNIKIIPIAGVGKDEKSPDPEAMSSQGSSYYGSGLSGSGSGSGGGNTGGGSGSGGTDVPGAGGTNTPTSDSNADIQENEETSLNKAVYGFVQDQYEKAKAFANKMIQYFVQTGQNIVQDFNEGWEKGVNGRRSIFGENVDGFFGAINNVMANEISNQITGLMNNLSTLIGDITGTEIGSLFEKLGDLMTARLQPYGTGEDPTFASQQAGAIAEWEKGMFTNKEYSVNLVRAPLNFENEVTNLYGNMVLGTPFLFGEYADPVNRTLINSVVRDGRVISLTPGLPKYNGSYYTMGKNNYVSQTPTFQEMAAYLLNNGISSMNQSKDRRYYTFEAKYDEYYEYLETILNTVYSRMGLSTRGPKVFDYMTFSNALKQDPVNGDSIDPTALSTLQEQYKNSIGFFINNVSLSEDISSNETSVGAGLASDTNQVSDRYQQLNYLTGMGTGGAVNDARRIGGIVFKTVDQARNVVNQYFSRTGSAMQGGWSIATIIKTVAAAVIDTVDMASNNDVGQLMESFVVVNGMKVMYPELWADSRVSKSVTIDYSFTSPYGDPASIFKYVYVPFFSLLTFAMPRMAADNGYISPFFVRASVPGVFNSDLAMISNINWQRGGPNNLWTKDNLPRCISGSFTLSDFYPYLSQIKHVSCLSHNPSYSIWTDSFSGQRAIYTSNDVDPLGNYFKQMINRISGLDNASITGKLWNRFSTAEQNYNAAIANNASDPISSNIGGKSITWMTKI